MKIPTPEDVEKKLGLDNLPEKVEKGGEIKEIKVNIASILADVYEKEATARSVASRHFKSARDNGYLVPIEKVKNYLEGNTSKMNKVGVWLESQDINEILESASREATFIVTINPMAGKTAIKKILENKDVLKKNDIISILEETIE